MLQISDNKTCAKYLIESIEWSSNTTSGIYNLII